MNQWLRLIVVMQIGLASLANAYVVEAQKMSDVLSHVTKRSWVVFDLDNTVMEPPQTLGSDQWFEHMVHELGSVKSALALWERVQSVTTMKPVERTTPALIRQLQRRGLTVFALTARPASLDAVTRKQLATMGVNFSKIVSIGPTTSKGQALVSELMNSSSTPEKVLFVDDKEKHVRTVEAALDAMGMKNVEFRYGAVDAKVHSFDAAVAQEQLEVFESEGILLSDEEARDRLGN